MRNVYTRTYKRITPRIKRNKIASNKARKKYRMVRKKAGSIDWRGT